PSARAVRPGRRRRGPGRRRRDRDGRRGRLRRRPRPGPGHRPVRVLQRDDVLTPGPGSFSPIDTIIRLLYSILLGRLAGEDGHGASAAGTGHGGRAGGGGGAAGRGGDGRGG